MSNALFTIKSSDTDYPDFIVVRLEKLMIRIIRAYKLLVLLHPFVWLEGIVNYFSLFSLTHLAKAKLHRK